MVGEMVVSKLVSQFKLVLVSNSVRQFTEVELQSSLSLTKLKKLDDTHTSSSSSNTYKLFSLDNKSNLI